MTPKKTGPSAPAANSSIQDVDDALLVARASDGDPRAFEVLVRRHARLLRAYARSILGSNDAVDDVVQEALLIAWQQLESVEDPGKVKAWLMRIVSRRAIDHLRASRRHADIDEDEHSAPETQTPSSVTETHMLARATEDALGMLPPMQRRCWVLTAVGGFSYREIADELQLPESTVRGLIARSRATMAREMGSWR